MTGTRQTKNSKSSNTSNNSKKSKNSSQNSDVVRFVWDEYGQTHLVNSLQYFKEFTLKEETLSSRFGEVVKSKGYGMIQVQVGPKKRRMWLSQVRYVPSVKGCVFSRHNGATWGLPTVRTPINILSTEDDLAEVGYVDDPFSNSYMIELHVVKPHRTNVVYGESGLSKDALPETMKNLRSQTTRKTVDPWNLRFLAVVDDKSGP